MSPVPRLGRHGSCYECKDRHSVAPHRQTIGLRRIDEAVKEKIAETVAHPEFVRAKVAEERKKLQESKPVIDRESIQATLADIEQEIQNFIELAHQATTASMVTRLAQQMNDLENQQRNVEKLLFVVEDQEQE
ncbi:MAG TPA: hypothetical protein VGD98_13215 [Ktedonobacteraceae bacterium]